MSSCFRSAIGHRVGGVPDSGVTAPVVIIDTPVGPAVIDTPALPQPNGCQSIILGRSQYPLADAKSVVSVTI